MKNLIILIIITLFALSTTNVVAQKANKTDTISIKTSSQCGMCKARLEKAMAYEKGIVSSELNVASATLSVVYKPTKTSPEKIRLAISAVGYDADAVKANQKSYNGLPACCKKGGMDH